MDEDLCLDQSTACYYNAKLQSQVRAHLEGNPAASRASRGARHSV